VSYSPVLAAVTAALEVAAAIWALSCGRRRPSIRTIAMILVFLAGYQVTEVAVCASIGAAGFLPRLAFLVVTWLPPLGVLLVVQLQAIRSWVTFAAVIAGFASALGMAVWILVDPGFALVSTCDVVFARYTSAPSDLLAYGIYYWAGLFLMLAFSLWGTVRAEGLLERRSLGLVFGGSAAFIVPSILLTRYVAPTQDALPSVMCHFALLFAIALIGVVRAERMRSNGSLSL
jgi:hypothetical protein